MGGSAVGGTVGGASDDAASGTGSDGAEVDGAEGLPLAREVLGNADGAIPDSIVLE